MLGLPRAFALMRASFAIAAPSASLRKKSAPRNRVFARVNRRDTVRPRVNSDEPDFSWVPFFEQLADALRAWRDRQADLLAFLRELRHTGLPVTPLDDSDETGRKFDLAEVDPFTFLGAFNRNIHLESRQKLVAAAASFFKLTAAPPAAFPGMPLLNNMGSWFISYQHRRRLDDVPRLWDVFEKALGPDPLHDPAFAQAFDRALQVRHTNINLTIGLFWIRPHQFLSLDSRLREHLGLTIPSTGLDARWYIDTIERVRKQHGDDFPRLSEAAGGAAEALSTESPPTRSDINYWFAGAYWDGAAEPDQTERFLVEGIWENGYTDRYLDMVRQIRPGDLIAIKSSTVQSKELPFDGRGHTVSRMVLKAIGTVVANRGDGRVVEVEWTPLDPPRNWYFYTTRRTLWRLRKDEPLAQRLIRFAFHGEAQDFAFFVDRWWGHPEPPAAPSIDPVESLPAGGNQPYGPDDLKREGVFLSDDEVRLSLSRLRTKKNLVLQGAPGTGKTFVARKLAYTVMEEQDRSRVVVVQFHPSTSYDDFVRGYRPTEQAGQFQLRDGPFLELCERARNDERPHVLIIDEINRGNLAQIFGELLMLLEADKRGKEHEVTPLYRRQPDERLYIPENVYVIGTMNLADRSLALVDFALRRRFAFMTLKPRFGEESYATWLRERGMPEKLLQLVVSRMRALNERIADDPHLGPALRIGHSFFCPTGDLSALGTGWFREIVETEIAPLLDEYWHDDRDKAQRAREELLA